LERFLQRTPRFDAFAGCFTAGEGSLMLFWVGRALTLRVTGRRVVGTVKKHPKSPVLVGVGQSKGPSAELQGKDKRGPKRDEERCRGKQCLCATNAITQNRGSPPGESLGKVGNVCSKLTKHP